MRNKATKQKSKKKGTDNAFGCDLIEHLQSTGQDVPQVLRKCAEFIEKHGIVDGIYRLSGVTSNIQRLRQEFCSEACPDLTKEVYLQDIHCVGSLCKLYFRELPNPLLTYELYTKFTVSRPPHCLLSANQQIVSELSFIHRTLEYLTKHLARLATLSTKTNMHTRNLALVWAPNLLRSKDIEGSTSNGDMAFKEVRVQQSIIEFILNHTEQIFNDSLMCGEKYATLPISGASGPMKLMSLEEAQARSLSPNHPVHKERQRENSLPDPSTAQLYHTVIDLDSKRKFSGKSKKWKSIFNLGKSVDSKGKLSRNGSVFIRAQGITEKAKSRKSRSMESLCSLPTGKTKPDTLKLFAPDVKSRTLGSDYLFDLSEDEATWEIKGIRPSGATAGWTAHMDQDSPLGTSLPSQKALPEQLKVFKGEDLRSFQPTSPKSRRMLYSSHSSSSRPSFSGNFFPLESSPRHQRRALNISEPFAVSVPLRVSAVISSNSTPCRSLAKDKAAALKIPELDSQERTTLPHNWKPISIKRVRRPRKKRAAGSESAKKQPSESDILVSLRKDFDFVLDDDPLSQKSAEIPEAHLHKNNGVSQDSLRKNLVLELDGVPRLSVCLEERRSILELENEDGHAEELDLVEPWEELNSAKQWVTSPLHSPDVEELFKQLSSTKPSLTKTHSGNIPPSSKPDTKWIYVPSRMSNATLQVHKSSLGKHKNVTSSQRFHRQMSHEPAALDRKEEKASSRHRPYSLNLDLGHRFLSKGLQPGSVHNCLSELDLFLNDNQAPLRRNSAPVSVSSVRTAFMIKTCQAKAVPVIPPKVQYSQIPHTKLEKDTVTAEVKESAKPSEKSNAPPPVMIELKEELENKVPVPKLAKAAHVEKTMESPAELPVITRRHAPSLEVYVDAPRTNKSNLLQRSSFRNRQRPQSLVLLSPPFPIMDYPSSGDDGKHLSSIKSLNDTTSENCRASEQVQNTMTIPKSGQRLETSTSCFYQPQRRSMIFDSRSHRQIE
uniref:Rho GTPase activating protein 31 n=1 Tax=Neogobius melanostomus TaxID=47308 RepID=A0A8C6SY87_9GOBI